MKPSPFPIVFPRQLRFWTFHCFFNALPSLVVALGFLQLWKSPGAAAAMTAAIATFILIYATITSLNGPLSNEDHVLARALKLGTKIRGWICGISVLLILPGKSMLLVPDVWCGLLAINLLNRIATFAGANNSALFRPRPVHDLDTFLRIYITTITEGLILSFILLMISFFAIMFLQARDRRKFFATPSASKLSIS